MDELEQQGTIGSELEGVTAPQKVEPSPEAPGVIPERDPELKPKDISEMGGTAEKVKKSLEAKIKGTTAEAGKAAPTGKQDSGAVGAGAEEKYVPNYKYKAADKHLEIPEAFRPLIKDKESERSVREIFEKVDGFERTKARAEKYESEVKEVSQQFRQWQEDATPYIQRVNEATKLMQAKDYDSFFELIGVPEQEIQQWMYNKLKATGPDADPMQRQMYQQQIQARKQSYEFENQQNQYKQKYEESEKQRLAIETKLYQDEYVRVTAQPEVAGVVSFVNSTWGEQAFLKEAVAIATQRRMDGQPFQSAAEAVNAVVEKYKPLLGSANISAGEANRAANQAAQKTGGSGKLPVIPRIEGQDMSPVKSKPKTLAELKELARKVSMEGLNNF